LRQIFQKFPNLVTMQNTIRKASLAPILHISLALTSQMQVENDERNFAPQGSNHVDQLDL
jgi:hypothetical protein